ncbi:hypothetical protein C0992_007687 [Termitomyces sp. T32_za158]|nr:hypothetical protein C0992_007687 [Termitomyces sp. T32_za158]
MAPSTKVAKVTKPGGKDIRMFFGAIPSNHQKASGSGSQQKDAMEISDDDSKATKKSVSPQKRLSESIPSKVLDLRDKASPAKKESLAKRKKTADSDSEEDNMNKPVVSRPRKKITVLDSSEDESPAKTVTKSTNAYKAKKPRASTSQKTTKKDNEFVADSNEFEAESSDAEGHLIPKGKGPRPSIAKKPKAKVGDPPTTSVKGKEKEKQEPKAKYDWAAAKAAKLAGPVAHGSKQVPDGAPNALAGLSFVFTGELSSFSREESIDLAKRYGGYVLLPL